jgi:hypothetical protein
VLFLQPVKLLATLVVLHSRRRAAAGGLGPAATAAAALATTAASTAKEGTTAPYGSARIPGTDRLQRSGDSSHAHLKPPCKLFVDFDGGLLVQLVIQQVAFRHFGKVLAITVLWATMPTPLAHSKLWRSSGAAAM